MILTKGGKMHGKLIRYYPELDEARILQGEKDNTKERKRWTELNHRPQKVNQNRNGSLRYVKNISTKMKRFWPIILDINKEWEEQTKTFGRGKDVTCELFIFACKRYIYGQGMIWGSLPACPGMFNDTFYWRYV